MRTNPFDILLRRRKPQGPAPLLYFFPEAGHVKEIPAKFAPRFAKCVASRKTNKGPGGGWGLLASPFPSTVPDYDERAQRWQQVAGVWLGIRGGYEPEHFLVESPDQKTWTYSVELGDGKRWLIPVAMLDAPNYSLSEPFETLDEAGRWKWETLPPPRYAELTAIAAKIWAAVDPDGHFEMEEDEVRSACLAALAVNYDLTPLEISALRLLTPTAYGGILHALIDTEGKREIVEQLEGKKKLLEAAATSSGAPDS